jgi:predicted RNase H-like HicB family nuclease
MRVELYFRLEPEGGYTVIVPALPGCITCGKTDEEARRMAAEAVRLYLEDMRESGEEIPKLEAGLLSRVDVDLPAA